MVDSFALARAAAVSQLMIQRRYREAIAILASEHRRRPDDAHVMLQLADAFAGLGDKAAAVRILGHLADQLAARGFAGKAVTALKRLQQIDPEQTGVFERVAELIEQTRSSTSAPPTTFEPLDLPAGIPELDVDQTREMPMPETRMREESFTGPSQRVVGEEVMDGAVPSPLFDDFTRDELLALMQGLELQVYDPGDVIVAQGDAGDSLFIIASGILKAFRRQSDNHHRQVRTLHDGDFFGEISILERGSRTATITAATRCELLELDRATLDAITAKHPRVKEVVQRYHDERLASDQS